VSTTAQNSNCCCNLNLLNLLSTAEHVLAVLHCPVGLQCCCSSSCCWQQQFYLLYHLRDSLSQGQAVCCLLAVLVPVPVSQGDSTSRCHDDSNRDSDDATMMVTTTMLL
jgi:hypothetical protein